jgi:hypothetical protein
VGIVAGDPNPAALAMMSTKDRASIKCRIYEQNLFNTLAPAEQEMERDAFTSCRYKQVRRGMHYIVRTGLMGAQLIVEVQVSAGADVQRGRADVGACSALFAVSSGSSDELVLHEHSLRT